MLIAGAFTVGRDITVGSQGGTSTLGGSTNSTASFTGAIGLSKNVTLTSAAVGGNTTSFTGPITGGFAVTQAGTGTIIASGANTYSGGANLTGGTWRVTTDAVATSGVITNGPFGTGTVTLNGGGIQTDGSNRTIVNNVALTGNATFSSSPSGGRSRLARRSGSRAFL